MMRTNQRLFLVALSSLIFTVVLFLFAQPWDVNEINSEILIGDANTYLKLADSFGITAWNLADPMAQRTPGYPAFIFVVRSLTGGPLWAVFVLQGLLHVLTAIVIFRTVKLYASENLATVAAIVFGTSLFATWYAVHELFSETIFTLLVSLIIYYLAKYVVTKPSVRSLLIVGCLIGVAVWVRPNGYWLLIPVAITLTTTAIMGISSFKIAAKNVILITVVVIAIATPWLAYNMSTWNHVALSSINGTNLLKIASRIEEKSTSMSVEEARINVGFDEIDQIENPFEKSSRATSLAMNYFRSNPVALARYWAIGTISWVMNVEKAIILHDLIGKSDENITARSSIESLAGRILRVIGEMSQQYYLAPILLLKQVGIVGLTFIGAFVLLTNHNRIIGTMLISTVVTFAILTGPFGFSPRFRIPAEPAIYMLASSGIPFALHWTRRSGKFLSQYLTTKTV